MPLWIAVGFACYAGLLAWQAGNAVELGAQIMKIAPVLLAKLLVIAVAFSYWVPDACAAISMLSKYVFIVPAWLAVGEAIVVMRIVLVDVPQPKDEDDFTIVFSLLSSVILPAFMFWFVFRVIWLHECSRAG